MMKNLTLYILLVFLVVANGFFLFNYMGDSKARKVKGPENPSSFIIKELDFNKNQLQQFRENNREHHENMMRLSDNIKDLKDELFNQLSEPKINEQKIDSITSLIGLKEKEKEKEIFYHFKSIQDICNERQKEKFNNLINDALHKGRERGPRPSGFGEPNKRRPPLNGENHRPPPKH